MESEQVPTVKRPTTFEEQVEILKSHGLVISDMDFAVRTLQRINYYRLSAYTLSLKKHDKFYPDITFEHIAALYEFDRRFRYLIMEHHIEKYEGKIPIWVAIEVLSFGLLSIVH